MIGAFLAGSLVGGFAGCAAMAWRHSERVAALEADSRKQADAVRALARRQAAYVQNTFGTPQEQEARVTGAAIFDMLDTLPTEAPNGRQF